MFIFLAAVVNQSSHLTMLLTPRGVVTFCQFDAVEPTFGRTDVEHLIPKRYSDEAMIRCKHKKPW
jgi:hypothetical protein